MKEPLTDKTLERWGEMGSYAGHDAVARLIAEVRRLRKKNKRMKERDK